MKTSTPSAPLHHFANSSPHFASNTPSAPLHHFANSSPHFASNTPSAPLRPHVSNVLTLVNHTLSHSTTNTPRKEQLQLALENILARLSVDTSNHDEVPGQ